VRRPSAILLPRGAAAGPADLASRAPLIGRQRVRRFRLRRRIRRRARSLLVGGALAALGLGALAGVGAAGHWALTSPRFGVARIEVVGERRLSADQIAEASGIALGENLWRLDGGAATARLLALAWVKEAHVVRRPPGRVVLTVREREPHALVQVGRLHWIDSEGVDLGPAPLAAAPGQPVVSGLSPEALGAPGRAPASGLTGGLALLRMLEGAPGDLRARVSEIDVGRPEGPVLVLLDGVEVRLGPADWGARLGRLQGVLARLEAVGEAVTAIDLRFRDQVVLKTVRDDNPASGGGGARSPRL
jgi:cell division protein FtsQ